MTKKSLIERAQQCLDIGKFTGHATDHPANVYKILEELLGAYTKLQKAQVERTGLGHITEVKRMPFEVVSKIPLHVREPNPDVDNELEYFESDYLVFEDAQTHTILAQVARTEFYDEQGNRFAYAGKPW